MEHARKVFDKMPERTVFMERDYGCAHANGRVS